MGKTWKVLLLALIANSLLATVTLARPVFLADGEIIQAQSVWREDDTIFVLLNRDSLITFSADQLDLKKTFAKKWHNPPSKPVAMEDPWVVVTKMPVAAAPNLEPSAKPAVSTTPVAVPVASPVVTTQDNPPDSAAPAKAAPPATVSTPAPATAAPAESAPPPAVSTPVVAPAPQPAPVTTAKPRLTPRSAPESEVAIPPFATGAATTGVLLALALIGAFVLLMLVSFWKVYAKAGQAGWKSLIPIYNLIVLLEIADCPLWWFLMFLIPVVNIFFAVVMHIKLAERFGKGVLFGFGLCFLGFIFFPILAFDDSTYG